MKQIIEMPATASPHVLLRHRKFRSQHGLVCARGGDLARDAATLRNRLRGDPADTRTSADGRVPGDSDSGREHRLGLATFLQNSGGAALPGGDLRQLLLFKPRNDTTLRVIGAVAVRGRLSVLRSRVVLRRVRLCSTIECHPLCAFQIWPASTVPNRRPWLWRCMLLQRQQHDWASQSRCRSGHPQPSVYRTAPRRALIV